MEVTHIKNKLIETGDEIWLEHTLRQSMFDALTNWQMINLLILLSRLTTGFCHFFSATQSRNTLTRTGV